ncbi:MAG: class I SAM-dependent methyltransferase [Rhodocyclaceae bacterium]|nr:class I SAM-dependent methyltransferase [Rhodocyclaceae bacterium]
MAAEQSKAAKRRYHDGAFHARYFAGHGIDIGGKPDPLVNYVGVFARMQSVRTWDLEDGDAQLMAVVPVASFDFVHSSHCLEHMRDPVEALRHWVRILKPGGYLIVTVPDEDLYEHGFWPSRFNGDHKWTFTVAKPASWSARSVNVAELLVGLADQIAVERLDLQADFFQETRDRNFDQTGTPTTECAIEFVARKRPRPLPPGAPRELPPALVHANLPRLRDAVLDIPGTRLPHGVVMPFASYSPWRADAAFAAAYQAIRGHTLVDHYRCWGLWRLAGQLAAVPGDLLEIGVWRGGTACLLALASRAAGIDAELLLADTFAGVVKAGGEDNAYRGGEHADTSEAIVRALFADQGLPEPRLLVGTFPEQTGAAVADRRLRLCHIDVDTRDSAADAFAWAWPRLSQGGAVVFDDYGFHRCEGVARFVDVLAGRPGMLCLPNLSGHAVVVKTAA